MDPEVVLIALVGHLHPPSVSISSTSWRTPVEQAMPWTLFLCPPHLDSTWSWVTDGALGTWWTLGWKKGKQEKHVRNQQEGAAIRKVCGKHISWPCGCFGLDGNGSSHLKIAQNSQELYRNITWSKCTGLSQRQRSKP